jgi:hypothetical protein
MLERVRIAESIGDRPTLADALVSLGLEHTQRTPTLAGILARAGVDIARDEQRPQTVCRGLGNLASLASGSSLRDVAALLEESDEWLRKAGGDPYLATINAVNTAIVSFLNGAWTRTDELLDGLGTIDFVSDLAAFIDVMLSDATGRPRRHPTSALEDRTTDDRVLLAYRAATDLIEARHGGDERTATAKGVEAVERVVASCGLIDDTLYIWPYAAETAVAAGDADALARVLAPVDDAPPGLVGVGLRAHRLRCAGLIAIADGDVGAVEPNLRAAITAFDEWGSPVYSARAQAELAQWLSDQRRTDDAEPLRRPAQTYLDSLGANGWLAQLGWDRADGVSTTTAGVSLGS